MLEIFEIQSFEMLCWKPLCKCQARYFAHSMGWTTSLSRYEQTQSRERRSVNPPSPRHTYTHTKRFLSQAEDSHRAVRPYLWQDITNRHSGCLVSSKPCEKRLMWVPSSEKPFLVRGHRATAFCKENSLQKYQNLLPIIFPGDDF